MKLKEKIKKFFDWLINGDDPLSYIAFFIFVFVLYNFIFTPLLSFITGSKQPILVILTPSMEHTHFNLNWYCEWWNLSYNQCVKKWEQLPFPNGINVGDIVISTSPYNAKIGDVLVMHTNQLNYPLVHRVIGLNCNGTIIKNTSVYLRNYPNCRLITKGDNNPVPDPFIIYYKDVEGKVSFVIPALGLPRVIIYKIFHI
jgi:hypothetical protein